MAYHCTIKSNINISKLPIKELQKTIGNSKAKLVFDYYNDLNV